MHRSHTHSAITAHWPGSAKALRPTPAPSYNLLLDARETAALMGISLRLFHLLRQTLPPPVVLSQRAVRWRRSDLEAHIAGLQADSSARPEPEQLVRGKAAKRGASGDMSGDPQAPISERHSQSHARQSQVPSNCEKEGA